MPASPTTIGFVLGQINKRLSLTAPLSVDDIIAERSGVRPLVVDGGVAVGDADWTALSRRHAVEVDHTRHVISLLGGKLTDCANVGDEVLDGARSLGLRLASTRSLGSAHWFGEPGAADRREFCRYADARGFGWTPRFEREATHSEVLWRRYGARAWSVARLAEGDADAARSMTALADYCEAEIRHVRDHEMVVTLEDFLRRRTPLLQLERPERLAADPGVRRAVAVLLGEAGCIELASLATRAAD